MKKYIYGGYISTGGKLDNGNTWTGFAVLLGEIPDGSNKPMFARACSASGKNEELGESLRSIVPGTVCHAFFGMPDANGRVKLEALQPIKG